MIKKLIETAVLFDFGIKGIRIFINKSKFQEITVLLAKYWRNKRGKKKEMKKCLKPLKEQNRPHLKGPLSELVK